MYILGISAFYHDSAATLLSGENIVAAAQEERFSRRKHDMAFPLQAIQYCLEEAKISWRDLDAIVFYDKPLIKFERIIETYLTFAPKGLKSFILSMPVWIKEKIFLKSKIKKELTQLFDIKIEELPTLLFSAHHHSHAASAFYPSPFDEAVVLCLDGVGEWATTSAWHGKGNELQMLWQINFPHSLGLLYSAFTYYCGFKVNDGEYKLMGLAPYGKPRFVDLIKEKLIDIKSDGSFRLNMDYFEFTVGQTMTNKKFDALFSHNRRNEEEEIKQVHMDIAASIQVILEQVIFKMTRKLKEETGVKNLCLAGGVALNCSVNGKLLHENVFDKIWIQPAAGDSGGSLGAAQIAYYEYFDNPRSVTSQDKMQGAFLGPQYSEGEIRPYLESLNASYQLFENSDDLNKRVSKILAEGKVVGWFQGRMEFGPRALGARSILADPRVNEMQSQLNNKIKFRESFRPFAPAILEEEAANYFEIDTISPYMLFITTVKEGVRIPLKSNTQGLKGFDLLKVTRSKIPAVTHVDYTARVQTVDSVTNPIFYKLLKTFKEQTGCPVLVNTSFNIRGEPIVCRPQDAYDCFMNTHMDFLVMENFLIKKIPQREL